MSIKRKKEGFTIDCESVFIEDDYLNRVRAIIGLIRNQDKDLVNTNDIFYATHLLEEMMPNEEQVRKMFST